MATKLDNPILVIGRDNDFNTITVGVAYAELPLNQEPKIEVSLSLLDFNVTEILSNYGEVQSVFPASDSPVPELTDHGNHPNMDDEAMVEIGGMSRRVLVASISIIEESVGYRLINELAEKSGKTTRHRTGKTKFTRCFRATK